MSAPGRTPLDRNEQRTMDVLLPSLLLAVPMWIHRLRTTGEDQRVALAKDCADVIAAHGDDLLYRSKKPGRTAEVFNALARGIAIGAHQPGGITVFGQHWCTDHDACTGAEAAPQVEPEPKPRPIVDVHLPDEVA